MTPAPASSALVSRIPLALWTLLTGALFGSLAFGILPTTVPHFQCLALFMLVALWDERRLLHVFAWLSPFFLANIYLRAGVYILDAAMALMLFADAARRLFRPAAARALEAPGGGLPFPRLAFLGAALFVGASLGAAIEPLRLFRQSFASASPLGMLTPWGEVVVSIYTGILPGGEGLRMLGTLLLSLGVLEFCYRRVDADFARGLMFSFGASLCLTAFLGLAEFAHLADLGRPYREKGLDYVDGRRRLMAFALHSGWLAEHLAMTWPFLIPAWAVLHRRGRQGLIVLGAGLAVAAILTRQRSLWLVMAVMAAGGAAMMFWQIRQGRAQWLKEHRGFLLKAAAATLAVLALADFGFGGILSARLGTLLRYQDRLYYSHSTFGMLREAPAGVGLGLHARVYDGLFLPKADFWQEDHQTAHNTWLHVAAERGPIAALALAVFLGGILWSGWKRARKLNRPDRAVAAAYALGLVGIAIDSLVQYVFYIRVIEMMVFIYAGILLGLRPARALGAGSVAPEETSQTQGLQRSWKIGAAALGAVLALGTLGGPELLVDAPLARFAALGWRLDASAGGLAGSPTGGAVGV
jgi:hypothetical protein